MVRFIMMMCS